MYLVALFFLAGVPYLVTAVDFSEYASRQSCWTSLQSQTVVDRPLLAANTWIYQPIWWSDESPQTPIAPEPQRPIMAQTTEFYSRMSWNKFSLSWGEEPQRVLTVSKASPTFGETSAAGKAMVADACATSCSAEYDGIMLVYHVADSGPFSGGGGWGNVNGDFLWMSADLGFSVTRHELGHCLGHPHHHSNKYYYRSTRETGVPESWFDGYDMMSGGNGYPESHLPVASKWWFRWVEDENVRVLAPEGAQACQGCVSSGTFELVTFDNHNVAPTGDTIMALHIPLFAHGNTLYSYWVSYRTGIEAASKGVSVHLSWFQFGGVYGASYDSLNFDAHGDTDTTADSFILPGTSYVLEPPIKIRDLEPAFMADFPLPVITVDSLEVGRAATVTVTFGVSSPPPSPAVVPVTDIPCQGSVLDWNPHPTQVAAGASTRQLLHWTNGGADGQLELALCTSGDIASAYVYDSYPEAPMKLGAPLAYGAMMGVEVTSKECCGLLGLDSLPLRGSRVVKVSNLNSDFLHLAEIEIFDETGVNVAAQALCFSKTSGYDGDPNCLNDGLIGNFGEICTSHSLSTAADNYDMCVFESPVKISKVIVYPFVDPNRLWMTARMESLKLELFAHHLGTDGVSDAGRENGKIELSALLATATFGFTSSQYAPAELEIDSATQTGQIPCPASADQAFPAITYSIDYGEAWVILESSSGPEGPSSLYASASCSYTSCMRNTYLDAASSACVACPTGRMSLPGAACQDCPAPGTQILHPFDTRCKLDDLPQSVDSSPQWMVILPAEFSRSGWALDMKGLDFYSDRACSQAIEVPIEGAGAVQLSESGSAGAGWSAQNLFDQSSSNLWGGRQSNGYFYVGVEWPTAQSVRCVKVTSGNQDHSPTKLWVLARAPASGQLVTVASTGCDEATISSGCTVSWCDPIDTQIAHCQRHVTVCGDASGSPPAYITCALCAEGYEPTADKAACELPQVPAPTPPTPSLTPSPTPSPTTSPTPSPTPSPTTDPTGPTPSPESCEPLMEGQLACVVTECFSQSSAVFAAYVDGSLTCNLLQALDICVADLEDCEIPASERAKIECAALKLQCSRASLVGPAIVTLITLFFALF